MSTITTRKRKGVGGGGGGGPPGGTAEEEPVPGTSAAAEAAANPTDDESQTKVRRNTALMPKYQASIKKYLLDTSKVSYQGRELNTFYLGPYQIDTASDGGLPCTLSATNSSIIPGDARPVYERDFKVWPFLEEGAVVLTRPNPDLAGRPAIAVLDPRTYLYLVNPENNILEILQILANNSCEEFNTYLAGKRGQRSTSTGKLILAESDLKAKRNNRFPHFTKIEIEVVREPVNRLNRRSIIIICPSRCFLGFVELREVRAGGELREDDRRTHVGDYQVLLHQVASTPRRGRRRRRRILT